MKCYFCNSKTVVKNGFRKTKLDKKQKYYCKNCKKGFIDRSNFYDNKTYNARIIYTALNRYNLGYSLNSVSVFINKKFKVKTSKSTIHSWVVEYKKLCPILKYREKIVESKKNLIFKKQFKHINLDYEYMLHNLKLKLFVENKYPSLFNFLKRLCKGCPNVFFEVGKRCSNPSNKINAETFKKKNYACRAAAFSVKAAKKKY